MLKETTISNNTKVNNTTRVATNPPDQPTRVAKYPSEAKTEELKISANEERGVIWEDDLRNLHRSWRTPRRVDYHHQQSFQNDASREGVTPLALSSSDRPTWSRLSPVKLTGVEGKREKNDAFKKINDARKCCCHRSARRP